VGRAARLPGAAADRAERACGRIAMDVALSLASARRCDLAVLSELLPAAEAGLVEALSIDRGRGDEF
jgi:hypothetical protein